MSTLLHRSLLKNPWLFLAVIAVLFRFPGTLWGTDFFAHGSLIIPHSDEYSGSHHVLEFLQSGKISRTGYFFGFPNEILWVLHLLHPFLGTLTAIKIVLTGRLLSVGFGVATTLLTYQLARVFFGNEMTAFVAGVFIAISPLHVVHSHYAQPVISCTFWTYTTLLCCLLFQRNQRFFLWYVACVSAGAAIAVKFGFITLIPIFYLWWKHRRQWPITAGLFLLIFSFFVWNWPPMLGRQLFSIVQNLIPGNLIERDHARWLNPSIYILELIPGLGLPVFLLSGIGFVTLAKQGFFHLKHSAQHRARFICLELPLICYACAICGMASPFPRHVVPLVPYLTMVAAYGAVTILNNRAHQRWATFLFGVIVLYQSLCVAWVEKHFIDDPIFRMRAWVSTNIGIHQKIKYFYHDQLFPTQKVSESSVSADYLLFSERTTLPFRRSCLTPLTNRPTINQGYHLFDDPEFLRAVYEGRTTFKPIAVFSNKEIFPEFWLYKKLFGSYIWRTGDWIIYRREAP